MGKPNLRIRCRAVVQGRPCNTDMLRKRRWLTAEKVTSMLEWGGPAKGRPCANIWRLPNGRVMWTGAGRRMAGGSRADVPGVSPSRDRRV
jgi:hypothetical protein